MAPNRPCLRRAVLVLAAMLFAGCSLPPPQPVTSTPTTTPFSTPVTTIATSTMPTVTTPTTPPISSPLGFSGAAALAIVKEQVLDGNNTTRYRVPGTRGNDEAAALIARDLRVAGWAVSYDVFNATYQCKDTLMHNVVGERAGTSGRIIILGAHYDTRPIAESDADPAGRTKPIPGANDGASGVAVLLELANVLALSNDTVRLVFFDGEDGGDMGDGCTDWLIGSRHYADSIPVAQWKNVSAMVLVDLVGDPNLVLPKEKLSQQGPGKLVQQRIYEVGAGLGYGAIFTNDSTNSSRIQDDHQPFLEKQMPAVDLIHLVSPSDGYFPEWHHTQHDDLSHVSAASLEAVGRTLEAWLESGVLS